MRGSRAVNRFLPACAAFRRRSICRYKMPHGSETRSAGWHNRSVASQRGRQEGRKAGRLEGRKAAKAGRQGRKAGRQGGRQEGKVGRQEGKVGRQEGRKAARREGRKVAARRRQRPAASPKARKAAEKRAFEVFDRQIDPMWDRLAHECGQFAEGFNREMGAEQLRVEPNPAGLMVTADDRWRGGVLPA